MNTPHPTAGQLIRELKPYFDSGYDLNVAVAHIRRTTRAKNWLTAAHALVIHLKADFFTAAKGLADAGITVKEPA